MLNEFSSPTDPAISSTMPLFTCGHCGASAQASADHFGVEHWDQLYVNRASLVADKVAEHDAAIPSDYSDAQWIHDREIEAWLAEHAKQHEEGK